MVCSNDSDLKGALRLIRADTPQVKIGLVMPLRETAQADGKVPNKRLTALADWVRRHIRDTEPLSGVEKIRPQSLHIRLSFRPQLWKQESQRVLGQPESHLALWAV